jgi:hypothetical protein
MASQFKPTAANSTNIPASPAKPKAAPRSTNGQGWKGAFGDSGSVAWQTLCRPRMWVALPAVFLALLVLIAGLINLTVKTATGEQNSFSVTPDGIITGSATSVRAIFGATQDQIVKGAQSLPVDNAYNRPLVKPSPAASPEKAEDPLQPNVE